MIRTTILGGLAALLLAGGAIAQVPAPEPASPAEQQAAPRPVPPQAFRSPEDGFAAFVAALRARSDAQGVRVLGSAGARYIRSGDPVADRTARERFLAAYDRKNEIVRPSADRAVLQVGDDGWPLPIPMIQRGGTWRFDAVAGGQEIANRRIGRNELDTIETLRAVVDAQRDFASTVGRQGAFQAYARRFFSSPGQRDGLYWPTQPGEADSPLGPFMAAASAGGYARTPGDRPQPYHGYFFRILEAQGPNAPGGAADFVVNGRMIGGFAVVAWPAVYGNSGIKTFMVSHTGVVYEQDLGPDTAREAREITAFDPGPGWSRVAE
ncbi:DUF2950 domain-containing protein [Roseomonas sp. JC162]|uniref:DUF2950 domain-containing protein n=1 Tax=Neoroseomonas marina TaxID=1232220 RepID=A0A848EC21_9PROT|nr:DUF2950 domain-containing protein [Neoroseomonas marina]NMJ41059.1 DUF2950 domain-containing protein [Neoroseomonas marina]